MRALPPLDACSCIVQKAPTPDLRIRAEISIDKEYEAHGCIKQQSCAILLIEPAPDGVSGGRFALLGGIQGRLFRINPFHGVGFVEAIADVFHVLFEQRFRTVASGGDHRVIGVRAVQRVLLSF